MVGNIYMGKCESNPVQANNITEVRDNSNSIQLVCKSVVAFLIFLRPALNKCMPEKDGQRSHFNFRIKVRVFCCLI